MSNQYMYCFNGSVAFKSVPNITTNPYKITILTSVFSPNGIINTSMIMLALSQFIIPGREKPYPCIDSAFNQRVRN